MSKGFIYKQAEKYYPGQVKEKPTLWPNVLFKILFYLFSSMAGFELGFKGNGLREVKASSFR